MRTAARILALFLAAAASPAQVTILLSPMPAKLCRQLLGRHVAGLVTYWTVVLENQGSEPVTIAESAVLVRIAQLQPVDTATLRLAVSDADRNDPLQRAGRATKDAAVVAIYLQTSDTIHMGAPALTALSGFVTLAPYLYQRLSGTAKPIARNFETLAWTSPVQIPPGGTAISRIATARWANPQPLSIALDVAKVPLTRFVQ